MTETRTYALSRAVTNDTTPFRLLIPHAISLCARWLVIAL